MVWFLLVLIVSRVGVAYGADSNTNSLQNFFFNFSNSNTTNANQVLALLVGPAGPPGPAGVAGRDGFVGMNGVDGMPGAPGPVGQQGPAGVPGPAGAPGPAGPAGPAGTGNALGYAGGAVEITDGCTKAVKISISRQFISGDTPDSSSFNLKGIIIASDDLKTAACDQKIITIYVSNAVSGIKIKCTETISGSPDKIVFNSSSTCNNNDTDAIVTNFFYKQGQFDGTIIKELDPIIGIDITA